MKKGITITSLAIYVVSFFTLLTITLSFNTNMTKLNFIKRGMIKNYKDVGIVNVNLLKSSKESKEAYKLGDSLVFSNNDEYYWDKNTKKLYKNKKLLCKNVEDFTYSINEETNKAKKIALFVVYNNYNKEERVEMQFAFGGV